jgi:nitrogen regulatory protein PII
MKISNLNKLIVIITESTIEDILIEGLNKLGVTGYTIVDARGKGRRGIRNSDLEASSNIRIEVMCTQNLAEKIEEWLSFNFLQNYAITVFAQDIMALKA